MNMFNNGRVTPSQWGGHGLITVSIRHRGYCYYDSVFDAFETPEEQGNAHVYAGDMTKFCSRLKLPEFLEKYYHFAQNFVGGKKPANSYYRRYYDLIPNKDLEKFVFDLKVADQVMEVLRTKTPSAFANISEDTIRQFVHVLDENEKPDISLIYFMANEQSTINYGSRWNEYCRPTKYILVDRLLNPIDVKAFMDVIDKIVFKPESEA